TTREVNDAVVRGDHAFHFAAGDGDCALIKCADGTRDRATEYVQIAFVIEEDAIASAVETAKYALAQIHHARVVDVHSVMKLPSIAVSTWSEGRQNGVNIELDGWAA